MRVKKYTAPTIKEALAQVRREMGDNALIISTKETVGAIGRRLVEVMAASDDNPPATPPPPPKVDEHPATEQPASMLPNLEEQIVRNRVLLSQSLKPLKQELFQIRTMVDQLRIGRQESDGLGPLREEVRELKQMLGSLTRHSSFIDSLNFSKALKSAYQKLLATDVDQSIAFQLIDTLDSKLCEDEKDKPSVVHTYLRELVARLVIAAKPVTLNQGRPSVMAFVGPTGVGKTTTIAKLAARCTLQLKKKVSLITIDTYRIAAVEQLKTYARIMDLPIFVCYTVDEMKGAVRENRDSALILVDTAGRSQADHEQVKELSSFFKPHPEIDVLLVLSATTKNSDVQDIIRRYAPVGSKKLVFTKLDETTTFGPIVNAAVRTKLPLAYFTTGQNVPDDIEAADASKIAGLILGKEQR